MRADSVRLALALSVFLGAVLITSNMRESPPSLDRLPFGVGEEVALVIVLDPDCGACSHPGLPEAWKAIVEGVSQAASDSVPVRLIGISMSNSPKAGLDFPKSFGGFHEVAVGGGPWNLGAVRYLFEDLPGPGAFPHVVILDRVIGRGNGERLSLESESVRTRAWGAEMIIDLARRYEGFADGSEGVPGT
mgnify:FL=1